MYHFNANLIYRPCSRDCSFFVLNDYRRKEVRMFAMFNKQDSSVQHVCANYATRSFLITQGEVLRTTMRIRFYALTFCETVRSHLTYLRG